MITDSENNTVTSPSMLMELIFALNVVDTFYGDVMMF